MKKWILKTFFKKVWQEYSQQIKMQNQTIINLKKKNQLLKAEIQTLNKKLYN